MLSRLSVTSSDKFLYQVALEKKGGGGSGEGGKTTHSQQAGRRIHQRKASVDSVETSS